ncbi:MAG: hypothetical protein V1873_04545 [Verrucomicrobiota bacterium]
MVRTFGDDTRRRPHRNMTEQEIIAILERAGPQTGAQLLELARTEVFDLWRTCRNAPGIRSRIVGKRFLRLDRTVEGYARLSPSIRREFLTYTVLGLEGQGRQILEKAQQLSEEIQKISRNKLDLARETIGSTVAPLRSAAQILEQACFIIAGDITYGMSHAVPRPESSTGKMVRGSDLDIIVVTVDDLPAKAVEELDDAIFKKKHFLLVHPDYREEIDYLIKNLSKVRVQLRFDAFESMIACKIMDEGQLLYGSAAVFGTVKDLLVAHAIPAKLEDLEKQAAVMRAEAEIQLSEPGTSPRGSEFANLFYTQEEGDEIY